MAKRFGFELGKKIISRVGRFFSTPSHLLFALSIYVALCLLHYLLVLYKLPLSYDRAGFITFDIATGGDPYNFTSELVKDPLLWTLALVIHFMSWLVVPVLIAMVVDAAYRAFEFEKLQALRTVQNRIRTIGRERLGLSGEPLENFVNEETDKMRFE